MAQVNPVSSATASLMQEEVNTQSGQGECSRAKVTQMTKAIFWSLAGMAAIWVPVPFLNGFICGSLQFMGFHAVLKHPDSTCMRTDIQNPYRSILLSRTWKHLVLGASICGICWGVGVLGLESKKDLFAGIGMGSIISGIYLSLQAAYSNLLFAPRPVEQEHLPLA